MLGIMSQDNLITLYNKEADEHITTSRNKKKFANADKLSLKKYSKKLKKHVTFSQTKKLFKKK
jgi:ribosomal protein L33